MTILTVRSRRRARRHVMLRAESPVRRAGVVLIVVVDLLVLALRGPPDLLREVADFDVAAELREGRDDVAEV